MIEDGRQERFNIYTDDISRLILELVVPELALRQSTYRGEDWERTSISAMASSRIPSVIRSTGAVW